MYDKQKAVAFLCCYDVSSDPAVFKTVLLNTAASKQLLKINII